MSLDVRPIQREHIAGWRAAVEAVAAERIYLGRITLPPHSEETAFPLLHIANGWPMFVALSGEAVVGWADVTIIRSSACWFIGKASCLAHVFVGDQHHDAVDARRRATMRRGAEAEGVEHAAEAVFHVLAGSRQSRTP
jgi:hypothetical protein